MPSFELGKTIYTTPDFHPDGSPAPVTSLPPTVEGKLVIPHHWTKLWGFDFGIAHPFAAVLTAWDRDSDVFYILKTYKITDAIPDVHAAAIRRIDSNAPIAWPHDGAIREHSGETLADIYRNLGLRMLDRHATFDDGGNSTEAAVFEMQQRMQTGRLRICEDLHDFWFEYRLYHREKGLIVKIDDDLLSATQKAIMMKRYGRPGPIGYQAVRERIQARSATEFDLFTGQPFDL